MQTVKICTVEKGQILGIEDAFSQRKHKTSVKCASTAGMVYQIKIEDLFKHFRKDERSWKQVKETSLLKDAQIRQKMKCKIEPGHTVLRKKDAYFSILDRY